MFTADFSDRGSNNRMKEEEIMMNWISFFQEIEGVIHVYTLIQCHAYNRVQC